jgi:hypothetical protein
VHYYLGTFGKIYWSSGKNNRYNIHIVNPIDNGMVRLSSAKPNEIFSTIAPTKADIIPIRYSDSSPSALGVNRTTILALTKKAKVPSRLLERNLCLPYFLPIMAAMESLIIRMENAVIKNNLGKIMTQIRAEIRT